MQKGNPPVERNIQRMFRRKEVATLIKRCNDFGAGGVSVAIGELADGLEINLDLVPKKYEGLDGTELAISESQERMAVVVAANKRTGIHKYAGEENLEATKVAEVTDTNRVRMYWRGKCILDISRDFLNTNGARQFAKAYAAESGFMRDARNVSDIFSEDEDEGRTGERPQLLQQKRIDRTFRQHHRCGYRAYAAGRQISAFAGGGNGCETSCGRRRNRYGDAYELRI